MSFLSDPAIDFASANALPGMGKLIEFGLRKWSETPQEQFDWLGFVILIDGISFIIYEREPAIWRLLLEWHFTRVSTGGFYEYST